MLRQCPECGTQSNGKKSLKNHRLTHGSVQCECDRQFRYLQDKLNHIGFRRAKRRHRYKTGRFQCAVCLRRFPENCRLSQHQRDTCHTGTRELDSDGDEHQDDLPVLHCPRVVEIRGNYIGLSSPEPTTDLYMVDRAALEGFVANNVQADAPFLGCCGEVIDDLVRTLQDTQTAPPELRPRKIIKSGSLGKGTAVKGRSDIDLILMLVAYEEVADLLDNLKDILGTLEIYLISGTTAKHQRTTRYSVQVEVTCSSGHRHDVDILPAVDLLGLGMSPSDVYRTMRGLPADTIHEYSVTLAPLQLEIISALPPKVKNLIKLVKYWKDKKLKDKEEPEMPSFAGKQYGKANWPSSYALELVILNAWSEAGTRESFDMTRALHAVLTSLVNHKKFTIVLDKLMKYTQDMLRPRSTPYIMDPVNPYNDMYHGLVDGEAFDWDKVVPDAFYWLSQPLFAGVDNTKYIW